MVRIVRHVLGPLSWHSEYHNCWYSFWTVLYWKTCLCAPTIIETQYDHVSRVSCVLQTSPMHAWVKRCAFIINLLILSQKSDSCVLSHGHMIFSTGAFLLWLRRNQAAPTAPWRLGFFTSQDVEPSRKTRPMRGGIRISYTKRKQKSGHCLLRWTRPHKL